MAINLKQIFKGAVETVKNYVAAHGGNTAERLGSTLEDKQYALRFGPVGSTAYNTALTNRYLAKNPSSIAFIGSAGKVGVAPKVGSTAAKVAQGAKAAPKTAIKNLPGYIQSQVQKAVQQQAKPGFLQTGLGKAAVVGGVIYAGADLATKIGLNITNTLDFYNWNGPIQTLLRNKFPWLFQASINASQGKKTPEIKRLTPDEVRQLQSLIEQQTGRRLTGEELRKAIFEQFGITVLEHKERASDIPGPLSNGDVKGFQSSVKGSTSKLKIKAEPRLMISNADELRDATMNEVSAFIQALPGRMSFDYTIKPTYVDADGKRRKGNFAVVKVSVVNKKGTKTEIAELPLGVVPNNIGTPTPLDGNNVAQQIQDVLRGSLNSQSSLSLPAGRSGSAGSGGSSSRAGSSSSTTSSQKKPKPKKPNPTPIPGTLQYGSYNVTPRWNFVAWATPNNSVLHTFFNPDDPSQNFSINARRPANALLEFITQNRRRAEVQPSDVPQLLTLENGPFTPTSIFNTTLLTVDGEEDEELLNIVQGRAYQND